MGKATLIEKIISQHANGQVVKPGDVVELELDARVARDFGGANVVEHLEKHGLEVDDPSRTFFTFDCNPSGSDQRYAANQQRLRNFARQRDIDIYDINQGIGTHLAIDEGFAWPGSTLVSTDSHANILGAIGAFGQGMGDLDIAAAFSQGRIWFKVPPTIKVVFTGRPGPLATAKDLSLALLRKFGAAGLLGMAAEITGDVVAEMDLDSRLTISSQATEMGGIIALFAPNEQVLAAARAAGRCVDGLYPDEDAEYADTVTVSIEGLTPLTARPGHPEDVVTVAEVEGEQVDSIFIGSCTNGRLSDIAAAATILAGRKVAPGRILKIAPATDRIWRHALEDELIAHLKEAGALFANAGCAGCANGQLGQNGPGETTVSTGNRNYAGKQGKGKVWLASPAVAAASAVAGFLTTPDRIPAQSTAIVPAPAPVSKSPTTAPAQTDRPETVEGRVIFIGQENIDTDMIYHNQHLAVTDIEEMAQYAMGNLPGQEDYPKKTKPGDILVTGANFGAGSSRQHAVDCFMALQNAAIVAPSFGSIYERNAINSGMPIIKADLTAAGVKTGDRIKVNFATGVITDPAGKELSAGEPMSEIQMQIYQRGGLLN